MLTAFQYANNSAQKIAGMIPPDTVWVDLLNPTPEDRIAVESALKLKLPSHDEMHDLEVSSRLYLDEGASYMIADVVTKADTRPETHAVMFVLTKRNLVTVRFSEAVPFTLFESQLLTKPEFLVSSEATFLGLVETIVGQAGRLLRVLAAEVESISKIIFWDPLAKEDRLIAKTIGMKSALYGIGHAGEISSRLQQSLLSIERLLIFYQEKAKPAVGVRLQVMQSDVSSLNEHATLLSEKIGFLMDATMGLINAEQNQIIKIFSVAAVIFLPPTLIASIYGMNFHWMPELDWHYGYPLAITLMALAAILPYVYFKRKRWI